MVPVATAGSSFEARVIAARLGADGIIWQFRGSVDGPLGPLSDGEVTVLVVEDDYETARELLLADEVEASFADGATAGVPNPSDGERLFRSRLWWVIGGVTLVIAFTVARLASLL